MHRFALLTMFSLAVAGPPAVTFGEDEAISWDQEIRPLVRVHCYRCHGENEPSGGVDLARDENPRLLLEHRKVWTSVLEVLRSGEMPPDDSRKLDDEDRQKIIDYLDAKLSDLACETIDDPGTPAIRRLTKHEFNLAIEDLTGLPIRPASRFAPESISFGFAGIGNASALTGIEVQQYQAAAELTCKAMLDAAQADAHLADHWFGEATDRAGIRLRLRQFADRAFRRPADDTFVAGIQSIYDKAIELDQPHPVAMTRAMSAVMMSPRFFLRIESPPPDQDAGEPSAYRVGPYDLASRLSFFLWSAPPDDRLLALAASGELTRPDVLRSETTRMLAHRRINDGLVRGFFAQWLGLRRLGSHQVDTDVFPSVDAKLRRSMKREVEHFLADLIRNDRPVTDLIDARHTFLDARLAGHYEITPADGRNLGASFERVELTDRRRGGVLVSAAVLMLQSDPGRTNVPRRGNFVAGTFLGDPPPPPPPDVPPLPETGDAPVPMTLRERLEQHRADAACASCHAKMDPIGFALENYDAIGRWRDQDAGKPVDASGTLAGQGDFTGPSGLKDVLVRRQDDLARTLTENLLIYALGRGPRQIDACVIRDAMSEIQAQEGHFSAIIHTIVQSFPFTHRSDPAF